MDDISKDQILRSLFQTVRVMANMIALKKPHLSPRVAHYARTIAQIMELDNETVNGIRVGATLHDFGLTQIPSSVLNKPDKLTEAEYEIIKQHPVHGFQILKEIDYPWPVARMILQHQERLDGTGYPAGLEGDEIILEARIIAVADVLDAMTSERPWRKALSVEDALGEIEKHKGTKYDPAVVDAACHLFRNKTELLDPEYYGRDQ